MDCERKRTFCTSTRASLISAFSLSPKTFLSSGVSSFQFRTGTATLPSPRSAQDGAAVVA